MLHVGDVLDKKYKILSEIGHGGMSVVYLAINERANKTWAVKEVRKDGVCDFEAVHQGLIVETDMLKKLNHPHLPSIIDVIDTEDSFLIVMDYVEGMSLQKVIDMNGPQPVDLVLRWGKQLCDVLGYLHNQNPPIIYRDMKPANIMLKPDGNITLIDFGTAREFKYGSNVDDTKVLGTRGYAPPEQYGGNGQTDVRADIYSLGATLYYLLSGHNPAQPPYEIKRLRYWDMSFAGSGIEKIIEKCCMQDRSERYQSAAELYYALDHSKEADDQAVRARNAKWYAFVFAVTVMLVGALSSVVSGIAWSREKDNNYDKYLYMAQGAVRFDDLGSNEDVVGYIRSALEIHPAEEEPYQILYDKATLNFKENSAGYRSIVDGNADTLMAQNRYLYDWIQYKSGFAYIFLSNTPEWNTGVQHFNRILTDSRYLDEYRNREKEEDGRLGAAEIAIAEICKSMGTGLERLSSKTAGANSTGLTAGERYTYKDYWNDLESMTEYLDTLEWDYKMVISKLIATSIQSYSANFKKDGVTQEEAAQLLELLKRHVPDDGDMNNVLYARAKTAVDAANDAVLRMKDRYSG